MEKVWKKFGKDGWEKCRKSVEKVGHCREPLERNGNCINPLRAPMDPRAHEHRICTASGMPDGIWHASACVHTPAQHGIWHASAEHRIAARHLACERRAPRWGSHCRATLIYIKSQAFTTQSMVSIRCVHICEICEKIKTNNFEQIWTNVPDAKLMDKAL